MQETHKKNVKKRIFFPGFSLLMEEYLHGGPQLMEVLCLTP